MRRRVHCRHLVALSRVSARRQLLHNCHPWQTSTWAALLRQCALTACVDEARHVLSAPTTLTQHSSVGTPTAASQLSSVTDVDTGGAVETMCTDSLCRRGASWAISSYNTQFTYAEMSRGILQGRSHSWFKYSTNYRQSAAVNGKEITN